MMTSVRGTACSVLVVALILGGCAGVGHYADTGLHVVDGVAMATEEACAPADCAEEQRDARAALSLPDSAVVVRVLRASPPRVWVDSEGNRVLLSTAGLWQPKAVVLELADGTRRAVLLSCGRQPEQPYSCTGR